jgi:hypothetical protein
LRVPSVVTGPANPSVTVVWGVTNQGVGPAVGYWDDELYLSTNAVLDWTATYVGDWSETNTVAAGGSYWRTNTVRMPVVQSGTYYLIFQANAYDLLYESDWDNNTLAVPVVMIRQNLAPVLSGAVYLSDGRFQLAIYGAIGTNYTLQASTNLVDWVPVLHFTCTNSPVYFRDTAATNYTHRFYRGVLP